MPCFLPREMNIECYCKVYVADAKDHVALQALQALIAEVAGGSVHMRTVSAPPLEIDVFDQSRHVPAEPGDDFVRWPAYLEIDASTADVAAEAFVSTLVRLLNGLRMRGLRVVAACDFEDTLAAATQVAGT
jgi:hypothetical protein